MSAECQSIGKKKLWYNHSSPRLLKNVQGFEWREGRRTGDRRRPSKNRTHQSREADFRSTSHANQIWNLQATPPAVLLIKRICFFNFFNLCSSSLKPSARIQQYTGRPSAWHIWLSKPPRRRKFVENTATSSRLLQRRFVGMNYQSPPSSGAPPLRFQTSDSARHQSDANASMIQIVHHGFPHNCNTPSCSQAQRGGPPSHISPGFDQQVSFSRFCSMWSLRH